MTKYKIEGGIDFFSELYKSLDDEEPEKEDSDNLCLITNLPLVDKYVQMVCGHKFNYIPLFCDIKNHKYKFNGMEGNASRLNKNEIRCPYCRTKQKGVLPYYEELVCKKVDGVNYIDPNYKVHTNHASCYKSCQFLTPNPNFNPNGENVSETNLYNNTNCKNIICGHMGSKINFQYGVESGENYGDEKYYCYTHKKQIIKKYKTEIAIKAKEEIKKQKEEAKQAKVLAKEEAKKQKEEAKQMAKQEKQKVKVPKKQSICIENVVLGPTIIESGTCIQIIKSGVNKGNQCGCHQIYQDNVCKRHFNFINKKKNELIT